MPAKTDPNVTTLLLLNLATANPSQADQAAGRAAVLGALGLTEQDATDALAAHAEQAEKVAADTETMDAADEPAGKRGKDAAPAHTTSAAP